VREARAAARPGPVTYRRLICRSSSRESRRRSCERSQGTAGGRARSAAEEWAPRWRMPAALRRAARRGGPAIQTVTPARSAMEAKESPLRRTIHCLGTGPPHRAQPRCALPRHPGDIAHPQVAGLLKLEAKMVLRGGRLCLGHEASAREEPVHGARGKLEPFGDLPRAERVADDELHRVVGFSSLMESSRSATSRDKARDWP